MKAKRTHNKSKDEILAELKTNQIFQEKMKFTKEQFFPALTKATHSIDDALQNLYIINQVVMDKFLSRMKEVKFKDLHVEDNLSKDDPKHYELKEMLELFNEMNVFEVKDLLEGMRGEINLFLAEENKSRTLADLKTTWIDEYLGVK